MTWRAWCSGSAAGVRTSILTASTTPAPHPARRVTPQTRWSQRSQKDFAETLGDGLDVPVLSESISKSAFPMMSNAALVWASRAVNRTFSARNRAFSPGGADLCGRFTEVRASVSPDNAPASRAEAHSLMCEW